MTLETILSIYMITAFIATLAVLLVGARLYRLRDQHEAERERAAERTLCVGGGEIVGHAEHNASLRSRNNV